MEVACFINDFLLPFAGRERGLDLDEQPVLPWLADSERPSNSVDVYGSTGFHASVREGLDGQLFFRALRGLQQQCGAGSGILQLHVSCRRQLLKSLADQANVPPGGECSCQSVSALHLPCPTGACTGPSRDSNALRWVIRATCPIIFDLSVAAELSQLVALMNWGLPVGHFNVRECTEVDAHSAHGDDRGTCVEFCIPLATATPQPADASTNESICGLVLDCVAGAAAVMERYMASVLATGLGLASSALAMSLCELSPQSASVEESPRGNPLREGLAGAIMRNTYLLSSIRSRQTVLTLHRSTLIPQAFIDASHAAVDIGIEAQSSLLPKHLSIAPSIMSAAPLAASTNSSVFPAVRALTHPRAHAPSSQRGVCMSTCARAYAQALAEHKIQEWAWDTQEQSIGCRLPAAFFGQGGTTSDRGINLAAADVSFDYCPAVRLSAIRTMLRIEPVNALLACADMGPAACAYMGQCSSMALPDGSVLISQQACHQLHAWVAHMNQSCDWGHCDIVWKPEQRTLSLPVRGDGSNVVVAPPAAVQVHEVSLWFVLANTFPPELPLGQWTKALVQALDTALAAWSVLSRSLLVCLGQKRGTATAGEFAAHAHAAPCAEIDHNSESVMMNQPYVGVASAVLSCGFVPLARPARRHAAQREAARRLQLQHQLSLPQPRAAPHYIGSESPLGGSSASVRAPPAPGVLCSPHAEGGVCELNALASAGNPYSCSAASRSASASVSVSGTGTAPSWATHGTRVPLDSCSSGTANTSHSSGCSPHPLGSAHRTPSHRDSSSNYSSSGVGVQPVLRSVDHMPTPPLAGGHGVDVVQGGLLAHGSFFPPGR